MMVVRYVKIEFKLSMKSIEVLVTGREEKDSEMQWELEKLGLIALHGEMPEVDGYYKITEIGKITKEELKKQYAVVGGRLYDRQTI